MDLEGEGMSEHTCTGFVGFGYRDNVNGLELTFDERIAFRNNVRAAIQDIGGTVLFTGDGYGVWEGVSERAGSVTFTLPIDPAITARKAQLRVWLAELAARFDQDCIALTFGDTVLIERSEADYENAIALSPNEHLPEGAVDAGEICDACTAEDVAAQEED